MPETKARTKIPATAMAKASAAAFHFATAIPPVYLCSMLLARNIRPHTSLTLAAEFRPEHVSPSGVRSRDPSLHLIEKVQQDNHAGRRGRGFRGLAHDEVL